MQNAKLYRRVQVNGTVQSGATSSLCLSLVLSSPSKIDISDLSVLSFTMPRAG
jgi:hypothetical protein